MTRTISARIAPQAGLQDATFSRTGMADYLVVFRKVTDSEKPVARPDGFIPSEFVGDFGPFEGMPAALRARYEQARYHVRGRVAAVRIAGLVRHQPDSRPERPCRQE